MEKKVFELKQPKIIEIEFSGNIIEVTPYITRLQVAGMINNYLMAYFMSDRKSVPVTMSTRNFLDAEYALKLDIIDNLTNIKVLENNKLIFDIDLAIANGLYSKIQNSIVNYGEFYSFLKFILDDIENQLALEKSLGSVIDGLMSKIQEILGNFSDSLENMKPEDLDKAKMLGQDLLKQLNESPISNIFKEAEKTVDSVKPEIVSQELPKKVARKGRKKKVS
jgi:hypothetical protein